MTEFRWRFSNVSKSRSLRAFCAASITLRFSSTLIESPPPSAKALGTLNAPLLGSHPDSASMFLRITVASGFFGRMDTIGQSKGGTAPPNLSRVSAEPRCRGRVLPFEMHPSSSPFEPRDPHGRNERTLLEPTTHPVARWPPIHTSGIATGLP